MVFAGLVTACGGAGAIPDAALPEIAGEMEITVEPPTLFCLSFQCKVKEAQEGVVVRPYYRRKGEDWRRALDFFRVNGPYVAGMLKPGEALFAGSIFNLKEDTAYEVCLELCSGEKVLARKKLAARTWKEPQAPKPKRVLHVVPGSGGGDGSAGNPYKGIAAAHEACMPGDLILLHAGVYNERVTITKSGTAESPIVWRAEGKGEAVLDGGDPEKGIGLDLPNVSHIFFEGIHVRNSSWGARPFSSASHIVFRRCKFSQVHNAIWGGGNHERIFIADCVFEGLRSWPSPADEPEDRAVNLAGSGHIVMHNRISNFKDGVDTFPSPNRRLKTYAIDICYNEIFNCTDDGIELDGSFCNTRAYYNRISNCLQGISFQPIFGGPAYAVRNALFNINLEPFKLHSTPYGGVILHNTSCRTGMPTLVWSTRPIHNFTILNNLFVGTTGKYFAEYVCPCVGCHLDANAYVREPSEEFKGFFKWNNVKYADAAELREAAGSEQHGLFLISRQGLFLKNPPEISRGDQAFSPEQNDRRIRPDAPVVDKALRLNSINDDFTGKAPDIGCYEAGSQLPLYGPRTAGKENRP